MPLCIVQNDITCMETDAIVNAANSALAMGGGVCGAIFAAAGAEEMTAACQRIGGCPVGGAVITQGFRLPAKHVIHAVGPVWCGGEADEAALLRSCYRSALELAAAHGCESISFPLISAGIYGYPKREALRIALDTIAAYLMEAEMTVYLVVFDRDAVQLSAALTDRLERWLDTQALPTQRRRAKEERTQQLLRQNLYRQAAARDDERPREQFDAAAWDADACPVMACPPPMCAEAVRIPADAAEDEPRPMPSASHRAAWESYEPELGESFSEQLLRRIDDSGMTDVETYKRANIDRRLFSKIRSRRDYTPSRRTAIALAVALRLNLAETRDLLASAGYVLSDASRFDLIVRFFIEAGDYDVFRINEALFHYGEPLLGA